MKPPPLVASPPLIGSRTLAAREWVRGRLVGDTGVRSLQLCVPALWDAFGSFLFIYVAPVDLAMLASLFALAKLNTGRGAKAFRARTSARWIAESMMITDRH